MSHLKCATHGRRVQVVNGKALHRNTGSKCPTKQVLSGKNTHDISSKVFHAS